MKSLLQEERFSVLLGFLLLFFAAAPFLRGSVLGLLLEILFLLIFLSCINAVSHTRRAFVSLLVLTIVGFGCVITARLAARPAIVEATLICSFAAYGLCIAATAVMIIRFAFGTGPVTRNKIASALCVYLLLGILWGYAYSLIEVIYPGSFSFGSGPLAALASEGAHARDIGIILSERLSFTYYSFVTLTTLGYGDITPLTDPARSLSVTEAIVGQFFLAVLIARLVGLQIVYTTAERNSR
jgi:hypothetical protein